MLTLPSGPAVKGREEEEWLFSGGNEWTNELRRQRLPKHGERQEGMAERWQSLTHHMPPRASVSLFFSCNLISQLHSVAPAFAQTDTRKIVHQCYKWSSSHSIVICCHTDFVLILAAWNTWLWASSWASSLKLKTGGFFLLFLISYTWNMYWTQEISATFYSLIKALPKKAPVSVAVFARGTVVNGYSVSF